MFSQKEMFVSRKTIKIKRLIANNINPKIPIFLLCSFIENIRKLFLRIFRLMKTSRRVVLRMG